MGLLDSVNRAIFTLTYNEQASKAYDDQNAKAAGAVEDLKKVIERYRSIREKIIGAGEATDYFASNSIARITEWENWLEKNAGLAAGDYSKKETEMKTQWDSILNSNKIVKEMARIADFIDLFIQDKDTKLPNQQKKELDSLKTDAETYYKKINNQSPADIIAKRDEFNRRFEEIQKKIPENFEDLKESFQDSAQAPASLLQGIQQDRFDTYKAQVEQRQKAEENTFSFTRLFGHVQEYFSSGFATAWPFFFGTVFAMIIANDAIGRPVVYRLFYAIFMFILFQVSFIPGFSIMVLIYYLYRILASISSWSLSGPTIDWVKAPVLFAFLPIFEGRPDEKVPWYISIFKYDYNRYGNLAQKKQLAYEATAAKMVGKELDASSVGMDEATFAQIVAEIQSVLAGVSRGSFQETIDGVKKLF